jgi:hypothetical protein
MGQAGRKQSLSSYKTEVMITVIVAMFLIMLLYILANSDDDTPKYPPTDTIGGDYD